MLSSAYEMAVLITGLCTSFCLKVGLHDQVNKRKGRILYAFRASIGIVVSSMSLTRPY